LRDHLFTGFPVALFAASYFYNTVVLGERGKSPQHETTNPR
jgi:hypothetical protein